jgi:lantibiotic modifying enzyme
MLNDPASAALVHQVAEFGQRQYDQAQRPWPSGTHDRQESPGLMLGLAGTGYFYLCAAQPAAMPSILLPSLETALPVAACAPIHRAC